MISSGASVSGVSGVRKAALLLVALGEEAAAAVYRHLSQSQLQRVTQEIAELRNVAPEMAADVLDEYYRLLLAQGHLGQGGNDYARLLLVKAFGEEQANHLMEEVNRLRSRNESELNHLGTADPQQLARFLEGEHPQTVAVVLAHLDPKPASALLMRLPESVRADAVKRLARLRKFSPDIVQKVSGVLHKRLLALGEQSHRAYAGSKGVADLLNRLQPSAVKPILECIEADDANLALNIRNLMFTFDDLISLPDSSLRELVARLDKRVLALALKGAADELRSQIMKCMSSRAMEMLKEDMEALGPVRARDANKAQQEAVALARQLEAEGRITLKVESADEYLV